METTNFNMPWRVARFKFSGKESKAVNALKANFNAIADNPAVGKAMQDALYDPKAATNYRFQSVDVAWRYLVKVRPTAQTGPINTTGLATELAGHGTGPALVNAFDDASAVGSEAMTKLGFGDDFQSVHCKVNAAGTKLVLGKRIRNETGQYAGMQETARFVITPVQ